MIAKRKKPNGSPNQAKRVKTSPLTDRTNQMRENGGNRAFLLVSKKTKQEESMKPVGSNSNVIAFSASGFSATVAAVLDSNFLFAEETLDTDCISSQEQDNLFISNERPSTTEVESNISNPPDSSSTSMDISYSEASFDEDAIPDEKHIGQDKPLTSFPKNFKSSSLNMVFGTKLSPPTTSNQNNDNFMDTLCFFDHLPEEILVAIFRSLPFLSRERVSIVCKVWYKISHKYNLLEIYPTDIYGMMILNMRKHRKHLRNYIEMRLQTDINPDMRGVLVDWLIEVAEEFRIQPETLFLAIRYIDQYLSRVGETIPRSRFQLIGMCALLIAAKHEELYVPTIADLTFISDNSYSREEIVGMEASILNVLNFDVTVFTVKQFAQFYFNIIFENAKIQNKDVSDCADYLAELSLLSYKLSMQRPDRVASAIISVALNAFALSSWPEVLQHETFFKHSDLQDCVEEIYKMHRNIAISPSLGAIRNKPRFASQIQLQLPEMRYSL